MSHKRQIFKISVLKKLLTDENSCVSLVSSTRLLALPPLFLNDMKSGIIHFLNSILKKYDRTLDGILIGYQNIKMLMDENTGIIPMGTAETEVNVRVEFYIFQPKIGSYLEGVVNKKSNNHIGCLVHTYFNATILKPEEVEYEDWICRDVDVNDKIIFRVKDLDFTGFLPYIEGTIDNEEMLNRNSDCVKKINVSVSVTSNNDSNNAVHVKDHSKKEVYDSKNLKALASEQNCEDVLDDSIGKKKKKSLDDIDIVLNQVKLKKKHKKSDKNKKETTESEDVIEGKQEKKFEDKNQDNDSDDHNIEKNQESRKDSLKQSILEFNDNEDDDVFQTVKKKKKKKKIKEKESIGSVDIKKVNEKEAEEDNVFYSTQLETSKEAKAINISFCSPIPQELTIEKKSKKDKLRVEKLKQSTMNFGEMECTDKKDEVDAVKGHSEMKKSNRKRKREKGEEESDNSPISKIAKNESFHDVNFSPSKKQLKNSLGKTSSTSINKEREVNGSLSESADEKYKVQTLVNKIYEDQMSRIMKQWGVSDRESLKSEEKPKRKSSKSHIKKDSSSGGKMDDSESRVTKLEESPHRENSNLGSEHNFKKMSPVKKIKEKKEVSHSEKIESSSFVDLSDKEQTSRVTKQSGSSNRESSVSESDGKQKRKSSKSSKKDKEKKDLSCIQNDGDGDGEPLFAKLLSEARKAVNIKIDDTPSALPNKQSNPLNGSAKIESQAVVQSNTSSGKKKNKNDKSELGEKMSSISEDTKHKDVTKNKEKNPEKSKRKRKGSELQEEENPPKRFKNGSMYDVDHSPLKVNQDKSLFSDSETSVKSSPVKKKNQVDVIQESEKSETKSQKRDIIDDLYKEMLKSKKELKAHSEKKSKSKIKSKEKEDGGKEKQNKNEAEKGAEENDSLYTKLLENAISFIKESEKESLHGSEKHDKKKKKRKKEKQK